MLLDYDLIVVKPKRNKIKIALTIILVLLVIALSVYGAIQVSNYYNEKQKQKIVDEQNAKIAQEQRIIEEQEKIRMKNVENLTQEQMQNIENIYSLQEEKIAYLTFDDGPTTSVTPFILDLLKQENIKATFFVLGNRAKANPDLLKREFNEGHYIANHGYTHKYSQIYQNAQTVIDEYNYTEECIQQALENPNYHSRVMRFPGGSSGGYYSQIKSEAKQLLRQNNIVSLDWNALSNDANGSNTKEQILQSIIDTVGEKQNVVILMHDSSDKILTYETLPDVIKYLREKGYMFKNLYDIL